MKRILIADDDLPIARLIGRILPDYDVSTTHNGLEALAVATALPSCDLLITDFLMPGMTGDRLMVRHRRQQPEIKTLVLSAFGYLVDINRGETDATLAKPFHAAVLRERVSQLIGAA